MENAGLKPQAFSNLLSAVKNVSASLTGDLVHFRLILVNWSILLSESLK